MSKAFVSSVGLLLMIACGSYPDPPSALHVELAGCSAEPDEGICERSAGDTLLVWVLGDGPVDVRGATVAQSDHEGGRLLRISESPMEGVIVIRRDRAEARIVLRPYDVPEAIVRAREARVRGELDAASAILDADAPRDERAWALFEGMRARLAFSRGDNETCVRHYDRSIAALRRAHRKSEWIDDALARAFVLHHKLGRVGEAGRSLDELERALGDVVIRRSARSLHRGMWLHATGDLRNAIRALEDAELHAARLEMLVERAGAVEMRSDALHRLGRHREAQEAMERLRTTVRRMDPCTRATFLTNLGWQHILEGDREHLEAARQPLREGWALFRGECPRPADAAAAAINLSTAALGLREFEDARSWLSQGRALGVRDGKIEAWSVELGAELALEEGDAETAARGFEELRARAHAAGWLDLVWRGELGVGRAHEALREPHEAIQAYERAERTVDEWQRRIPLDGAHRFFVGEPGESARRLVRLALRAGEFDVAFSAARHARRRALASMLRPDHERTNRPWEGALDRYWQARELLTRRAADAWTVPREELSSYAASLESARTELTQALDDAYAALPALALPEVSADPASDALTVVLFPLENEVAVLATDGAHFTGAITSADPDAVAAVFTAWRDEARPIRVLAHERANDIALHAALTGDSRRQMLGALRSVTYGLDLPVTARSRSKDRDIVIVADAGRDLDGARREARLLASSWRASGRTVRVLEGRAATHRAVIAVFGSADVLHYAGHGEAGEGLWRSGLVLADDRLTIADVLASRRVPGEIWLIGCETGRAPDDGAEVALASAFVAAGAEHVIATTEPISDDVARRFLAAASVALPASTRVQRAYAEGDMAFAAFRLFTP